MGTCFHSFRLDWFSGPARHNGIYATSCASAGEGHLRIKRTLNVSPLMFLLFIRIFFCHLCLRLFRRHRGLAGRAHSYRCKRQPKMERCGNWFCLFAYTEGYSSHIVAGGTRCTCSNQHHGVCCYDRCCRLTELYIF